MRARRNLRHDLFALALLAATAFLAVALVTRNPADPPSSAVYPAETAVANSCGRLGAAAAYLLLQGLGVGAYYLVISLAVFDALLLMRRPIGDPIVRGIGWVMSLGSIATLAAFVWPAWEAGPVIGPGGYLGAAGRGLLELNFASTGALILATSVLLAGLLLCTDYLLLRLSSHLVRTPAMGITYAGRALLRRRSIRAGNSDVGDGENAADDEALPIRIRGKNNDEPAVADAVKAENAADKSDAAAPADDDEQSQSEQGEAVPARPGMRSRLAAALGLGGSSVNKEREEVMQELDAASRADEAIDYELPSLDLLLPTEPMQFDEQEKDVRRKAKILEKTFANFGFKVKVVEIESGPVIAQFEVELEAGLRLSKITSLADDLAIALRVPSVRIVAPIPGKNTVGVEVPNSERQLVRLREVVEEAGAMASKMRIPIFLGKDVSGKPMVVDLASLPHLLIAGRTGTGKSVCLNSMIISMLMTRRPDEVRMLLIDPKMVELSTYKRLPHLMHPVVTDMRKAEAILAWAVEKMEERYALLANAGVRHIGVYNQLGEEELMDRLQPRTDEERAAIPTHLPYIVIVADEIADLMMTAAKEVEQHIIRLAQKSRAVGIHLVLATQKPTVDVITGLIKSNLPARIAFQVASRTDSRVVLDEMGADRLLGNGDMLFLWPGTSTLLRGQGTYVSDDEINRVVDFVGTTEPQFVKELVQLQSTGRDENGGRDWKSRDDLYEAAIDIVVREGRGSVSLLQRALGIGYGRAARLVDYMAEDGIVGTYNGSQAREVLLTPEQWDEMNGQAAAAPAAAPARTNRILPSRVDDDETTDEEIDQDEMDAEADDESDELEEDDRDDGENDAADDEADGESDEESAADDAPFDEDDAANPRDEKSHPPHRSLSPRRANPYRAESA